ncbi:hypothetical protein DSM3645_29092 [Blastopirellula marina DSM 3645]|uniref:Uncharacterized protein n=1 Tax=Blastopirellula marina DSM 3645 TaxID=314230 RepID=A3ZPP0_9BACT|nr:hypothetical protein DSM3645_29092 [Blastopirellula marina DSM 3645]
MPACNEELNLERAHAEITAVIESLVDYDHEFIFTENHLEGPAVLMRTSRT